VSLSPFAYSLPTTLSPTQTLTLIGLPLLIAAALWRVGPGEPPVAQPEFSRPTVQRPVVTIPPMVDITHHAGLFTSHLQGSDPLKAITESYGAGVCLFDADGDGRLDILQVAGSGENRYFGRHAWWSRPTHPLLYLNLGANRFREVGATAGLTQPLWGMGCAAADLDNDGDTDLYITTLDQDHLYRNEGDGTFVDISLDAGLGATGWSSSVAIADYDGDGLLDLYVVGYLRFSQGALAYERGSGFEASRDYRFAADLYDGSPNRLLHNLGGLRFEDRAQALHLDNPSGRGQSARWHDLDGDRRPDLLVANSAGSPNRIWLNRLPEGFVEQSLPHPLISNLDTPEMLILDLDNDREAEYLLVSGDARPNQLFSAKPPYGNLTRPWGLADEPLLGQFTQAMVAGDLNNDGWLDLAQANGLLTPDTLAPRLTQAQGNTLLLNRAGRGFDSLPLDTARAPASSRAVVTADLDQNGSLELLFANNNSAPQLLSSGDPDGAWVEFDLRATRGNRDAIGARLDLRIGAQWQRREVELAGHLGHAPLRQHFGLGTAKRIDELLVTWRDGTTSRYTDLAVNQLYRLEDTGQATPIAPPATHAIPPLPPLFNDPRHARSAWGWLLDDPARGAAAAAALAQAWDDLDAREQLLKIASEHPGYSGLRTLIDGLSEARAPLRRLAVEGLAQYESEFAAPWLLARFSDPDAEVRCALAEAYRHFYREEEALTLRKYQALPELIRLLDDPRPSVRMCTIAALAEAENHRAVVPLIAHLHDRDAEVSRAAAQALGSVREGEAIPALEGVLDEATAPTALRVAAMGALRRLSAAPGDELLERLLIATPEEGRDPLASTLLCDTEAGLLFGQASIVASLQRHTLAAPSTCQSEGLPRVTSQTDDASLQAVAQSASPALTAALNEPAPLPETLLSALFHSPRPWARLAWRNRLLSEAAPLADRRYLLQLAAANPADPVVRWSLVKLMVEPDGSLWSDLLDYPHALPLEALRPLLEQVYLQPTRPESQRYAAISALMRLDPTRARTLLTPITERAPAHE